MSALSAKLRSVAWDNGVTGIAHWCPACRQAHALTISGKNSSGAQWSWDGNAEAPSCSPSINIKVNTPDMGERYQPHAGTSVCHYFLRSGFIEFLSDCTHDMRGQRVAVPDWPKWSRDEARFL